MKVCQRLADDLQGRRLAQASSTGIQDALSIVRPEMTNWNLGASEVQATHQRNIGSGEIRIGRLPQHLIILFTKPPHEMNIRCEGVKRNRPPPVGSMALVPAGAVADASWRGNKDRLLVSVEPNLVQRVAAKSFERDLSSAAIQPLNASIPPEPRSAMQAIGAESEAGAPGGPLMIESLANILAVHLIRCLFGFRRAGARAGWSAVPAKARRNYRLHHGGNLRATDRHWNEWRSWSISADIYFARQFNRYASDRLPKIANDNLADFPQPDWQFNRAAISSPGRRVGENANDRPIARRRGRNSRRPDNRRRASALWPGRESPATCGRPNRHHRRQPSRPTRSAASG